MKKMCFGQTKRWLREVKAVRYAIVMILFFVPFALFPSSAAQADEPNLCISLSTGTPGAPVVTLDLFASYKSPTVYALNGTALSTQAVYPPLRVTYVVSGTAYVTTTPTVEFSLTGTAEDSSCNCVKEVAFHVIFDGSNDSYTEIISNPKDGTSSILSGNAEVSQSCGN